MSEIIAHLKEIDWPAFVTLWGMRLLIAGFILVVGIAIARVLGILTRRISNRAGIDATLVRFLGSLTVVTLTVVAAILALDQLGVNTTSLIAVLGAAGLAVGLALKDSLSNFASSVMIMTFKPFRLGDFVEAAGVSGTVEEIGMFNTWMKTPDNQVIVIPNSSITNANIVNYSREPLRRLSFEIGISYKNQIEDARRAILEVVAQDERIKQEPAPIVYTWAFGESSVNLMLRVWTDTHIFWDVRSDLLEGIKNSFDSKGISIPFPQREIRYFKDL